MKKLDDCKFYYTVANSGDRYIYWIKKSGKMGHLYTCISRVEAETLIALAGKDLSGDYFPGMLTVENPHDEYVYVCKLD